MKKSIIKSAKTKDAAIKLALDEIGKSRDEVEVEIIEEESSGFLGLIGSKDAVVRVSYEEDIKEALSNLEKEIENTESFVKDYDYKEEEPVKIPVDDVLEEKIEPIEEDSPEIDAETKEAKDLDDEETKLSVDYGKAKQKLSLIHI